MRATGVSRLGKPSPPAPPAREGRGGGHPEDVGLTREGQPDMNPQGQKGWREGKEASQIKKLPCLETIEITTQNLSNIIKKQKTSS